MVYRKIRSLYPNNHLLDTKNIAIFLFCTVIIISTLICIIIYFNNSVPIDIEISEDIVEDTDIYQYDIDKIEKNNNIIKIYGWAVKKDMRINTWESYTVLKDINDDTFKVFKNFIDTRDDIKQRFNGIEYRYELSGFKTSINKTYLKEGRQYKVYLLYRNNNENVLLDLREEINV